MTEPNKTNPWTGVLSLLNRILPRALGQKKWAKVISLLVALISLPAAGASGWEAIRNNDLVSSLAQVVGVELPGAGLTEAEAQLRLKVAELERNAQAFALDEDGRQVRDFIRSVNPTLPALVVDREAWAIVKYSKEFGLPLLLTVAVSGAESTFNPSAVGPSIKGQKYRARGTFQVLHGGREWLDPDPRRLHEIDYGSWAGCRAIREIVDRYPPLHKNLDKVLQVYVGASHPANAAAYLARVNDLMRRFALMEIKQVAVTEEKPKSKNLAAGL